MPAYAARQILAKMQVFRRPGSRIAARCMHMSGHLRSATSWELKGNHQVPWSLMSPSVQEHSLPVATGLLGTTCVQKLHRSFRPSVVQAICAMGHPSPRQLSVPKACYSDAIEAGRHPFTSTIAFVTELIPTLFFTIALTPSCETLILVKAVSYH